MSLSAQCRPIMRPSYAHTAFGIFRFLVERILLESLLFIAAAQTVCTRDNGSFSVGFWCPATFWTENWLTGYSYLWERSHQFYFYAFLCSELQARTGQTDGRARPVMRRQCWTK